MDMLSIEKKWQQKWKESNVNAFDNSNPDNKYYVLEMFSYPSGAKLHCGHWFNYGLSDTFARYMKMKGKNVFQPMGFDAFGLPAENFAIKTGIHPKDSTLKNIETMHRQLDEMGAMYDWENEVITCMPDYYKWTQWMFLQLYKKGLAYRKEAPVNWCPSCKTVLANEQVINGACERCGDTITRKNLTQWFFKITEYAEELLQCLDKLDWPEKTKLMQKNWIGKSVGGEIIFNTEIGEKITVFTTHAETLFGSTFMVIAPEHPLIEKLTTAENKEKMAAYIKSAAEASEIERQSTTREKTGVFTGSYAINPLNGKRIPIFAADYVIATYGTGCVMGVPGHDARDFEFATKYGLDIPKVVSKGDPNEVLPIIAEGNLVNSGKYDGLSIPEGAKAILADLEAIGHGKAKVNYRLRDWLVSRQRYWGAPIPMVYCDHCGEVPVPEKDLPVELPYNVEFKPDGKSPLAKCDEYINTVCPICGRPAKRDPDTLDTFVCSSWYFLRYPDNKNSDKPFDTDLINKMLPVDKYIGGAEHACMHLLYARFFTKALRDMGYLNFDEPFTSLIHQGTILGPDGEKMSKSRGNVVSPDTYVCKLGSDTFRMYLMFCFSFIEGGAWNDDGLKAIMKFLERVEKIVLRSLEIQDLNPDEKADKELEFVLNNTIKSVDRDLGNFSFNTAIARLMELTNALYKYDADKKINAKLFKEVIEKYVLLLAPFMPHIGEELWETIGGKFSVFGEKFPVCDEKKAVKEEIEIAIQINSKIRAKMNVPTNADDNTLKELVLANSEVSAMLEGKTPVKIIVVKGRLINLIVK